MTGSANCTLKHLLDVAARLIPGLNGIVDDSASSEGVGDCVHVRGAPQAHAGNGAALEALLAYWSNAHPEAGRPYWASRCWGILIWQPVYLSVIGVHAARASLSLTRVAQPVSRGWTREVRLPDHAPEQCAGPALIAHAASEITACSRQMRDDLMSVIRLNPAMVNGTLADVVLAALLAARKARPDWSDAHVQRLGERWLAALALDGHGGYFAFERPDGSCALALDRKTCCYHYRRSDGDLCSTCPRLAKPERIVRLNMERDAALDA